MVRGICCICFRLSGQSLWEARVCGASRSTSTSVALSLLEERRTARARSTSGRDPSWGACCSLLGSLACANIRGSRWQGGLAGDHRWSDSWSPGRAAEGSQPTTFLLRIMRRAAGQLPPAEAGRGYGCRKDENPDCKGRARIAAEPLEAFEGHVIDQWAEPSGSEDPTVGWWSAEAHRRDQRWDGKLQRQKKDAFRMKLRREVDLQTFKTITKEIDTALDQLDREHKSLTRESVMPELPDPSRVGGPVRCWSARADGDAGGQDHHRAAPEQDRQGYASGHPVGAALSGALR